jgi:hypothetical protein
LTEADVNDIIASGASSVGAQDVGWSIIAVADPAPNAWKEAKQEFGIHASTLKTRGRKDQETRDRVNNGMSNVVSVSGCTVKSRPVFGLIF